MVLLVYPLVDEPIVEQAVRVVEANLLGDNEHSELQEHPMKCRQLTNGGESTGRHRTVAEKGQRNADQELIKEHRPDDMEQPVPVHRLVGIRLHLVLAQELWAVGDVQEYVQAAKRPVHEYGPDGRSIYPQLELVLT